MEDENGILSQDYFLSVAISLSYICLFVVLTLYKYEVMFRYGVFLVAICGPFCQLIYGLPYILIVWRFFVGSNVSTDQELYIGRLKENTANKLTEQNDIDKADFSGSTTLSHWVVVIKDGDSYYYTHAVGAVTFGKGRKIPFRNILKNKLYELYSLNHVGFVTRRRREEKLREIVDNEPMVSGNSCQEYAVDIAFQISSSRTYTFVKILTLPRLRNTIFYIALIASIVFRYSGYTYARLLSPLIITNLFAAWELSRIGIHNKAQGGYMPVIRAYIQYPTKGNFLVLLLFSVCLVYLYFRLGMEDCIFVSVALILVALIAALWR